MFSSTTRTTRVVVACAFVAALLGARTIAGTVQVAAQQINLVEGLKAGRLKAGKATVTALQGDRNGVQIAGGGGLVWIDGSDFAEGTIEIDVRGRDVLQQSFVGVAFHGQNDTTHEIVYLRPFNFRAEDPARHQHAVQYVALPDYDWARLRKEFPEEFENPVDASVLPTDWVPLRILLRGQTIQIFVGAVTSPTLEVRKLGTHNRGMIGLWAGGSSDSAFAHLRITPMK